jgi:phosphoribosylformimino-5-aminoimidazole carboxamide ribotide isomerase
MKFRPCIDLHNGKVKQIVGSTLSDDNKQKPVTNFESDLSPGYFAALYARDNLPGGHVIMLGPGNETAACEALRAFPGGLQAGGGITPANAAKYLDAGASHVIVTSYVFRDGQIDLANLRTIVQSVGKNRLVLDLSCKKSGRAYFIATDRWQKLTETSLSPETLLVLGASCDEFLVHAVDVEGKQGGIDEKLVALLAKRSPVIATYAGGIRSLEDLDVIYKKGKGRVDATIGSALDIFGGKLSYRDVVGWHRGHAGEWNTIRGDSGTLPGK